MVLPVSNALKQSQLGSDKVACQWGVGPEVKGGGLRTRLPSAIRSAVERLQTSRRSPKSIRTRGRYSRK